MKGLAYEQGQIYEDHIGVLFVHGTFFKSQTGLRRGPGKNRGGLQQPWVPTANPMPAVLAQAQLFSESRRTRLRAFHGPKRSAGGDVAPNHGHASGFEYDAVASKRKQQGAGRSSF